MNNNKKIIYIYHIIMIFILAMPTLSFAYVGPGAGITFLGALWAVITAIVLAVGGFLVWPIRALIRKKKLKKQESNPEFKNPTK